MEPNFTCVTLLLHIAKIITPITFALMMQSISEMCTIVCDNIMEIR